MQIQLNQREIEIALKAYIVREGINLVNKSIEIAFTAGRKEAGILADLIIEDIEPITDIPSGPIKRAAFTPIRSGAADEADPAPVNAPELVEQAKEEEVAEGAGVPVKTKSAASLFGT